LIPTNEVHEAGKRIDPPVSDPIELNEEVSSDSCDSNSGLS